MIKAQLKVFTSILGVIGIIVGAYLHLDTRFAQAEELNRLEQRVLNNELNQAYRDVRKEMYELRELVRKYPDDKKLKEQLESVEDDFRILSTQLKK